MLHSTSYILNIHIGDSTGGLARLISPAEGAPEALGVGIRLTTVKIKISIQGSLCTCDRFNLLALSQHMHESDSGSNFGS